MLAHALAAPSLDLSALPVRRKVPPPELLREHELGGRTWSVALPVTFTPFASAQPCSARCVFCSETLWPRDSQRLSASLRPGPGYHEGLARALAALRGLPLGISLSGLESTDVPEWLLGVLDVLEAHERHPEGRVEEKVLYSNAAGLCLETSGAALLPRLERYGLTRVEISRHHHEAARNDGIMRFRPGQPVARQEVFEETVRAARRHVPVRLVCIVQRMGVSTAEDVEAYLAWAVERLGVTDVVFREFSRLHGLYRPNRTQRTIERDRVAIESLLAPLLPGALRGDSRFEPLELTQGYYYWNVRMRWRGQCEVTFEASDYQEMKARHRSGVVHKFVFHANGNLCADWDPEREVLLRTA
jgi:hypothetical protein